MSSFICNDLTINRIVTFLSGWDFGHNTEIKRDLSKMGLYTETDKDIKKFGLTLLKLNFKATSQRYNNKLTKEEKDLIKRYKFIDSPCKIEQAYMHLSCLTYQMLEGNIPQTELYKLLERIETQIGRTILERYLDNLKLEWEAKEKQEVKKI